MQPWRQLFGGRHPPAQPGSSRLLDSDLGRLQPSEAPGLNQNELEQPSISQQGVRWLRLLEFCDVM